MRSALAARQWEAHLSQDRLQRGERAWLAPGVLTYRRWVESLWSSAASERATALNPAQCLALWRRVIDDSALGDGLLGHAAAARWAAEAWRLICAWQIDPAELRAAADEPDFAAFLDWSHAYREQLRDRDWIDDAALEVAICRDEHRSMPTERVVLADLEDSTPAQQALLARCEQLGTAIERWSAPQVSAGVRYRVRLADTREELRCAARWARSRLERAADRRIALVVPSLDHNLIDVERVLVDVLDGGLETALLRGAPPFTIAERGGLAADSMVGAALTALELLTPQASFGRFSRWLRSPFFHGADPGSISFAAMLERQLRGEVSAQLGFLHAYREAGLAASLRARAPELAVRLEQALALVGVDRRYTPSRWALLWPRALEWLGWSAAEANPRVLRAWETALVDFAQLTPILGELTAAAALRELRGIATRAHAASPWPIAGLHVFAHIDDIGPGYDAAWVVGFTDGYWPQSPRCNPLLPRRLQLERAMPWSSPQDALRRSEQSLRRLLERVPDLVFSWPARVYEHDAEPSPLIRSLPERSAARHSPLDRGAAHMSDGSNARSGPARSPAEIGPGETLPLFPAPPRDATAPDDLWPAPRGMPSRIKELIVDTPPALDGTTLPGGTAALNAQARCPLRAFCEHRLGARPLDPVGLGLAPRLQGIVAHRALELLLAHLPSQSELLADMHTGVVAERIDRCVQQALSERFGAARAALGALFQLERARLGSLLAALLEAEARRAPFRVEAVEQRVAVAIGWRTINVRIDRLDRLADRTVAIIDYKTGRLTSATAWLTPRLRDTQIPLYAQHLGSAVSAAVIVALRAEGVGYTGIWVSTDAFPDRSRKLPEGRAWAAQLELWRGQTELLVEEFAAGDTRVFCDALEEIGGAYAPLTRIYEQLGLHRERAAVKRA